MIRKFALAATAALTLAACTAHEQRVATGTALGAAGGAAVGAIAGGTGEAALIGAGIGAASGAILAGLTSTPGKCSYRNPDGTTYIADCPPGY
jgi:hypothetical protein